MQPSCKCGWPLAACPYPSMFKCKYLNGEWDLKAPETPQPVPPLQQITDGPYLVWAEVVRPHALSIRLQPATSKI